MTQAEIISKIELACVCNASYKIDVLAKYIQASYSLDLSQVKSAILFMINQGTLDLTLDVEVVKWCK